MISQDRIVSLARAYQTTALNVRREYVQHLFLSSFYTFPQANRIFFKGGTAIRIVYGSPRFSEDLDFSATALSTKTIEDLFIETIREMERAGVTGDIVEAKETSGGYLAELRFRLLDETVGLVVELSRRARGDTGEVVTVVSDFIPAYTVVMLDKEHLVKEKIRALTTRAKPRDFYDLYFLLRANLLGVAEKRLLAEVRQKIPAAASVAAELRRFLPKSHWRQLTNFQETISAEIERNT